MNLEELIKDFRLRSQDTKQPYLWSDDEIIGYANESEVDACQRAHLLLDSSSEVTELAVVIGDGVVPLDQRVIAVRRARLEGVSMPLRPMLSRTLDERFPDWENATPSIPQVYVPDWQTDTLLLVPPPDQDYTMRLTVVREPLKPMKDMQDKPEIRTRYHSGLVDGMLARAYLKQDADAYDKTKADAHEEAFSKVFGPAVSALDEYWSFQQYNDVGEI